MIVIYYLRHGSLRVSHDVDRTTTICSDITIWAVLILSNLIHIIIQNSVVLPLTVLTLKLKTMTK